MPRVDKSIILFLLCGLWGVQISPVWGQVTSSEQKQNDDFTIGMFSFMYSFFDEEPETPYCDKKNLRIHTSSVTDDEFPSSQLNILKEDGFNTVQVYMPANYTNSLPMVGSLIGLAARNGMRILLNAQNFYHPYSSDSGRNIYGNEIDPHPKARLPEYPCKALPDYNYLFKNLYASPPYCYVIWGHQISEEASFFHFFNKQDYAVEYNDTLNNINTEVPPAHVQLACEHFRSLLTGHDPQPDHKFVIMEAFHHGRIHDQLKDGEGIYNPQDYLKTVKADVFFEGSYVAFNPNEWFKVKLNDLNKPHYLGPMMNIDYARKYIPEVHKVINIERRKNPHMEAHFHTDTSLKNANWLWFQAYQSILKGVRGIWFWELVDTYAETDEKESPPSENIKDRFTRKYFPKRYNQFVAPLARELAYLHQNGYLNKSSVLATKTDQSDDLGIIPPVKKYMTKALKEASIPTQYHAEFLRETYGIQYTIRTNGQDTILILTNPVNVTVSIDLDLKKFFPGRTQAEVLFIREMDPLCKNYKTNRDSGINLESSKIQFTETFPINKSGKINCIFAPADVWVLRLKK